MHHQVTTHPSPEGSDFYDMLKPGDWFWGWKPEGVPMLKVEGGYCSPVNGHIEHDNGTCYFVGKKVWKCPPGTNITILIDGDLESLRIAKAS